MAKELSRRDFLKGTAATVAGAAALGLMGKIPAAQAHAEEAEEEFLTAEAYANKKWKFEVMPKEYPIAEDKIAKVFTNEIVVVGSGMSGLTTAVSAQEGGADVRVISAGARAISRGGSNHAIGSKKQKELGIDYSPDTESGRHAAKVEKHSASCYIDERKWSNWINHSGEAMDWMIDKMESKGLHVSLEPGYVDPDGILTVPPGSHSFWNEKQPFGMLFGAPLCAQAYADIFTENGGVIDFKTKALYLIRDDNNTGRVSAVVAQNLDTGEYIKYEATKAVVLATGDFSKDPDMMAKYAPWAWKLYKNSIDTTKVNYDVELAYNGLYAGDGHKMGLWAGGKMQDNGPFPLMLHPQANAMFHGCFPFVNTKGERFMNEGTWVQGKSMNIMNQPGNIAYSIFDKNYGSYNRQSLEGGTGGGMFWDTMMASIGQPFADEDVKDTVESDVANGNTLVADTLEELAEKIGCPVDVFMETMKRYNEMVAQQCDDDFHKPAEFLYPVEEGPFYAAKVGVALLAVVGGLSVNTDLQVLNNEKEPIPGLFATGNASGDLYAIDYPINMAGNSNGRCFIWGYLLGQRMPGFPDTGEELTPYDELIALRGEEAAVVADTTVYNDGVYEGVGTGRNGEIKVAVTVTDGKIAAVEVLEHAESADIGAAALPKLVDQAVAANSAAIDGASGASMTSEGFRQAVAMALELAK